MTIEKALTNREMMIRKLEDYLLKNTDAFTETLEAINCYKKAPVPTGLYVYRNELDLLIKKQMKQLSELKKEKHEAKK